MRTYKWCTHFLPQILPLDLHSKCWKFHWNQTIMIFFIPIDNYYPSKHFNENNILHRSNFFDYFPLNQLSNPLPKTIARSCRSEKGCRSYFASNRIGRWCFPSRSHQGMKNVPFFLSIATLVITCFKFIEISISNLLTDFNWNFEWFFSDLLLTNLSFTFTLYLSYIYCCIRKTVATVEFLCQQEDRYM